MLRIPTKKKSPAKKSAKRAAAKPGKRAAVVAPEIPASTSDIPPQLQQFLRQTSIPQGFVNTRQIALLDLRNRVNEINVRPTVPLEQLLVTIN